MDKEKEIKVKAQNILLKNGIETYVGDEKALKVLKDIIDSEISPAEIEIVSKTVNNLDNYFFSKSLIRMEDKDFEFLKKLAELLRNQKIRIEDETWNGVPIFNVTLTVRGEEKTFSFITREGRDNFIDVNGRMFGIDKETNNDESEDRRKSNEDSVEIIENLEIRRLLDVIKRNF